MRSKLILQIQNTDGSFICEEYDNLPSPRSVYIVICFADNHDSELLAKELRKKILFAISNLGTQFDGTLPVHSHSISEVDTCANHNFAKLLIVLSDGKTKIFKNSGLSKWSHKILPILRSGTEVNLPAPFDQPQVAWWHSKIDTVIPVIFGLIGISDEDLKIFISYRRTDTSELANQLFEELNKRRFEVFLDKYSINPSVQFQTRLYQELADKAMVIFLESENFLESPWIQLEVDFAKINQLGRLALNINNAPKLDSIDDEYRIELTLGSNTTLDNTTLNNLLDEIEKYHSVALYFRKNYLNGNIEAALASKGMTASYDSFGLINNGINDYKIWTTPRPPDISDFHYIDGCCTASNKIIFGPQFIEDKRKTLNDWLVQKSSIDFYNEGQIIDLTKRL